MFTLHAHKKLYTLLFCTLLIVQPLHALFDNPKHNDALFYLLFFGGCAVLGMITSYFNKINPKTKTEIKTATDTKEPTKKLELNLNKRATNLPVESKSLEDILAHHEKKIKSLKKKYINVIEQNNELLKTINTSNNIPAFMAAVYWFNMCKEQAKIIENYKKSSANQNVLSSL